MPAQRPRASFEPISPDLDILQLVNDTDNFQFADRVAFDVVARMDPDKFEKLVTKHCIVLGKPLVIDGLAEQLDPWTFNPKWLADNHGANTELVRDITQKRSIEMTIKHYLTHMGKLTDQFFVNTDNYKDKSRQRMYLKDIDCPQVWEDKLKDLLPPSIFYWNDSTGDIGGPGAALDPTLGARRGKGIAAAGDLMSSLPQEMRAANLMCYIGHEGTYTPSHREMCATMSHNIMVNTSGQVDEDGNAEKPGSSIWFMTETKDRNTVAEFWRSILGHDVELEDHFAQIAAWQRAPFTTYVVEQRVGDFVLIPPLAPHQVWNRGTRTIKIAWNRTTVETLEFALHEALHSSRMVCREEQYKCKAMIYYTLLKYSNLIKHGMELAKRSAEQYQALSTSKKFRQLQKDFRRLFDLYKEIMLSEMLAPDSRDQIEYMPTDTTDNLSCSYCRCNIFNRFLTCKNCNIIEGKEEPYDVCMDCYAMGRSCACQSGLKWVEQFKWKHLIERYNYWRQQIIQLDGGQRGRAPELLEEERKLMPKRTLAEICQRQLKLRPFVDVKAQKAIDDEDEDESEEEVRLNEDGTVKKVVKKRTEAWLKKNKPCHSCLHRHQTWKMANCTNCDRWWCYGILFRAYDLHPITIMEDPRWECPHCLKICNTGACRKDPRQNPYTPRITHLGHDTRKVADFRSVEALFDFAQSNLNFISEEGEQLQRFQHEAAMSRQNDHAFGDDADQDIDFEESRAPIAYDQSEVIDPALAGTSHSAHGVTENRSANDIPSSSVYPELNGNHSNDFAASGDAYYQMSDADPQANTFDPSDPSGSKKRTAAESIEPIKVVQRPAKRHKKGALVEDEARQNKASKQFQHEANKKQLDKARKEGRYLRVWSQMNNRSLPVTLVLPSHHLYQFERDEELKKKADERRVQQANVLLRSDILPPPIRQREVITASSPDTPKSKATLFRARIEEDDDFHARSRKGPRPKRKAKFEEITVLDDSEEEFAQAEAEMAQRSQPRKSDWLARKKRQDGDENLPDELPDDWKDGTAGRKRNRKSSGAPSALTTVGSSRRAIAQKAPRIRPANGGAVDLTTALSSSDSDENNNGDDHDGNNEDENSTNREIAAAASIARAAMEEDANLQAKLHAMDWDDQASSTKIATTTTTTKTLAEEPSGRPSPQKASNNNKKPQQQQQHAPDSLMSRMKGKKKIRIVSSATAAAAAKTNGGGGTFKAGPGGRPPGRTSLPA